MGNSASVTPNGTTLASPRPDIDVELCPPGTMGAIANAVKAWDKWDTDLGAAPPAEWVRAMIPLEAILTAHRERMGAAKPAPEAQPTGAQLFALWLAIVISTASIGVIISGQD